MEPVLCVRNLSVPGDYPGAPKDISFTVGAGEIFGLVGPHGSGKTLLLNALSGTVPSSGLVHVNTPQTNQTPRPRIARVTGEPALWPHLSVWENLLYFARSAGLQKSDAVTAATEIMEQAQIYTRADARVRKLSPEITRRVNVAASLVHRPDVLLLDAPLKDTDPQSQSLITAMVRRAAEQGSAVIWQPQATTAVETLCDKVLLMYKGRLAACDTPNAVLSRSFGSARTVTIRFTTPPDARTAAGLTQKGFAPTENDMAWSAFSADTPINFNNAVQASLKHVRDRVREISVSRPGFPTLLHHLEKVR